MSNPETKKKQTQAQAPLPPVKTAMKGSLEEEHAEEALAELPPYFSTEGGCSPHGRASLSFSRPGGSAGNWTIHREVPGFCIGHGISCLSLSLVGSLAINWQLPQNPYLTVFPRNKVITTQKRLQPRAIFHFAEIPQQTSEVRWKRNQLSSSCSQLLFSTKHKFGRLCRSLLRALGGDEMVLQMQWTPPSTH